jgi:hypothetical protein
LPKIELINIGNGHKGKLLYYFILGIFNVPNYFSCDRLIKVAHYKKEKKIEFGTHLTTNSNHERNEELVHVGVFFGNLLHG